MTDIVIAKCNCGALKVEAAGKPILQLICHCRDCRAATGDDFASIVFFKKSECSFVGELKPHIFTSYMGNETQRVACAKCNDVVIDKSAGFSGMLGMMAAKIELPFLAEPKIHVWTQSRLEHVVLPDGVKAFEKGMS